MKTLAMGPLIGGRGTIPYRIVLRAETDDNGKVAKYVIHTKNCPQNADHGSVAYHHGHYFIVREGEDTLLNAITKFNERVLHHVKEYGHNLIIDEV